MDHKPKRSGAYLFHPGAIAIYSPNVLPCTPRPVIGLAPTITISEAIEIVMAEPDFGDAPPSQLLDIFKVSTPEEVLDMMRIAIGIVKGGIIGKLKERQP